MTPLIDVCLAFFLKHLKAVKINFSRHLREDL
jgi:hypothetical protein